MIRIAARSKVSRVYVIIITSAKARVARSRYSSQVNYYIAPGVALTIPCLKSYRYSIL
jgi:hypothetical protein